MDWRTRLIHSGSKVSGEFHSLTTPTYRGSTVAFRSVAEASDGWQQSELGYTYGLYGTPTTLELAARSEERRVGKEC